ncbi:MAG: hypothetical protein NUW37_05915 [Planctomycetes bacterium]|nr:hypothetical protein [Planctomycetota bacterium]
MLFEDNRYTAYSLKTAGAIQATIVLIHLPDKNHKSSLDQHNFCHTLAHDVVKVERQSRHDNTIILGDFNVNPFDLGFISPSALNSLPCLKTARMKRKRNGNINFFYNPCWNLLGDRSGDGDKVAGTFFYKTPSDDEHYWNVLDQVILRPSIGGRIRNLRVMESAPNLDIVDSRGRPGISDHLPIYFELDMHKETEDARPLERHV